jgi:hypothetical protein
MPDERFHARFAPAKPRLLVCTALATALLSIAPEHGGAVSRIAVDIGDLVGKGWSARDVSVTLELPGEQQTIARVYIKQAILMPEIGPLQDVSITCRNPVVKEPVFACRGATVDGKLGRLGRQQLSVDLEYQSEKETLTFSIDRMKVAQGRVQVEGRWLESGWTLTAETKDLVLAQLRQLVAPWFALPQDLTVEGRGSLNVTLRGTEEDIASVQAHGSLSEVTANNAAGTLATDKLGMIFEADLKAIGPDWEIHAKLGPHTGQAYSDPIFLDLGEHPADATVTGRWISSQSVLQLAELKLSQKGMVTGALSGELDFAGENLLRHLRVDLERLDFPASFQNLMLPFLLDTELKDLKMEGKVSGIVEVDAGTPAALALELHDVNAAGQVVTFRSLGGQVNWLSSARRAATNADGRIGDAPSRLEWQSGALYGISTGGTAISFVASGGDFRLLEPTRLPILDGGLAIAALSVKEFGQPQMSVRFEGQLEPISVSPLSRAFGWPEFSGTISGRIPRVSLEKDVLSLGGDLEAEVFGGRVTVSALKLQNPLGDYPQFSANITMRNLDLEAVTGTFSFGKITGRLNADIADLELFQWAPVRFDARLYTPPGDKSRHLISQRAVNNLSNIGGSGGGVTAALSSGFLRFFENFRYDRLGLSCKLQNEICLMDGIEPYQGEAYYIVKGSSLPRINIIGNARRVSWTRLVSQLVAIQQSGGPVVE